MTDLDKFISKKMFTNILGEDYKFTDADITAIKEFGDEYGFPPNSSVSQRTVGNIPSFIKYGLHNIVERIELISKCKRNSLEHYKLLFGDKLGEEKYKTRSQKCANTLDRFIEKYGVDNGTKAFNDANNKRGPTLENYIRRHGKTDGPRKLAEYKAKCSHSHTVDGYIEKYGDEIGKQKFDELYRIPRLCIERMISKYGDEGILKYAEIRQRISSKFKGARASQESLNVFLPVIDKFPDTKYHIGYYDKNEYYLWNTTDNEFYTYDLCFPEISLIFEFNGEHVHPDKEHLTDDEWNKWICPWTGKSADEAYAYDMRKHKTAIENGFSVYVIWRKQPVESAIEHITQIISERHKNC